MQYFPIFIQPILLEFMYVLSPKSLISPFDSRNPRKTRHRESLRLQRISELQNNEVWDDGYQAFLGTVLVQRLILQRLTHFTEFFEILKKIRVGCTIDVLRFFSHFQVFLGKNRVILNRSVLFM